MPAAAGPGAEDAEGGQRQRPARSRRPRRLCRRVHLAHLRELPGAAAAAGEPPRAPPRGVSVYVKVIRIIIRIYGGVRPYLQP